MQGEVEIIYQILGSDRHRMVSAAPHARTSFGVTGIRTESLPLAVSVSGKRDFGARENAQERPADGNDPVSENKPSHGSPPTRGLSHTFRKSPIAQDCVVGSGGLEPPTR